MTITFRRAVRENVGLIIGLAGPSGSGKTYTAMRLASGIAGDKPFAVIDTEAGRAKHYADLFRFDHADLKSPFRPATYSEAIKAADEAGYPVIVVDSASHVWEGEGGVLDWQEEILTASVKRALERESERRSEWSLREAFKRSAWITPKMEHKKMVSKLLQLRAHLILCLRAEDKIDFVKDDKGNAKVVPMETLSGYKGWIPICDKRLPYELTASFILLPNRPGVPVPIKLQEQHKALFPLDKPITEESGRLIAVWAAGGTSTPPADAPAHTPDETLANLRAASLEGSAELRKMWEKELTREQRIQYEPHLDALKRAAALADVEIAKRRQTETAA